MHSFYCRSLPNNSQVDPLTSLRKWLLIPVTALVPSRYCVWEETAKEALLGFWIPQFSAIWELCWGKNVLIHFHVFSRFSFPCFYHFLYAKFRNKFSIVTLSTWTYLSIMSLWFTQPMDISLQCENINLKICLPFPSRIIQTKKKITTTYTSVFCS